MRKTVLTVFILSALFVLLFAACKDGGTEPSSTTGVNSQTTTKESSEQNKVPETETKNNELDWGVGPQRNPLLTTESPYMTYIRFPQMLPNRYGTGYVAKQEDKTLIIFDSRNPEITPEEADGVDHVLDAYIGQTLMTIDAYRNSNWDNFSFEITSREHMKINGYEMCKYIGVLHCTYKGSEEGHFFAAYSSEVNGGKDYVYWMVMDDSEDQSLHDIAEYNADQMAKTLEG